MVTISRFRSHSQSLPDKHRTQRISKGFYRVGDQRTRPAHDSGSKFHNGQKYAGNKANDRISLKLLA
jgi:hypothetical protein